MEDALYIQLGEIRRIAKERYTKYHRRCRFEEIIQYLYEHDLLLPYSRKFKCAAHFLDAAEFNQHVGTQLVNASSVLSDIRRVFIREANMVPVEKDIFTTVHLPYIHAEMHSHDYFEINYVYSGSCTQEFDNESRQFHEGDLVIIAPNSPHRVCADGESLIICMNIRQSTFDRVFWQLFQGNDILSTFLSRTLYGKQTGNYLTFTIENSSEYQQLIQQIFDESTLIDDFSNNMSISLVNIFFGKLMREFGDTIHLFDVNKTHSFNNDFPIIIKYVHHNYATVSLSVLSQVFHYSEVYLSKMFKKNLDKNFASILQHLKLQHAKEYLEFTDCRIANIAQLVGYDSVDHLSRTFKKAFQVSPSKYRYEKQRSQS